MNNWLSYARAQYLNPIWRENKWKKEDPEGRRDLVQVGNDEDGEEPQLLWFQEI